MSSLHEYFGFIVPDLALLQEKAPLFVGLECEVESILGHSDISDEFVVHSDGSLRNNGLEFVTPPVTVEDALGLFKNLHQNLQIRNVSEEFSPRTSIHVHVNMSNLDKDTVRNIILMYALFEEFFFRMTLPERRENIHCVPLTETHLPSMYQNSLDVLISKWHKYTALNLKPLKTQGTLEFRHMHGHADDVLLQQWLTLIQKLVEVGGKTNLTEQNLNKVNIDVWFKQLFSHTDLTSLSPFAGDIAYNSILDLKLAV